MMRPDPVPGSDSSPSWACLLTGSSTPPRYCIVTSFYAPPSPNSFRDSRENQLCFCVRPVVEHPRRTYISAPPGNASKKLWGRTSKRPPNPRSLSCFWSARSRRREFHERASHPGAVFQKISQRSPLPRRHPPHAPVVSARAEVTSRHQIPDHWLSGNRTTHRAGYPHPAWPHSDSPTA